MMPDMTWNKRNVEFTGEKMKSVLWKDANIDKWSNFHGKMVDHMSILLKLDVASQSKILKMIIYKHHNQMRRDKSFQYVKKVQILMERYCKVDINGKLRSLLALTRALRSKKLSLSKDITVPDIKYFEMIMERLIGSCKLAEIIVGKCQEAARYLYAHMKLGFFVQFNMFAIASISRLWFQIKETIHVLDDIYKVLCGSYQDIFSNQNVLPAFLNEYLEEISNRVIESKDSQPESQLKDTNSFQTGKSNSKMSNSQSEEEKNGIDIGVPLSLEDMKALRNASIFDDSKKQLKSLLTSKPNTNFDETRQSTFNKVPDPNKHNSVSDKTVKHNKTRNEIVRSNKATNHTKALDSTSKKSKKKIKTWEKCLKRKNASFPSLNYPFRKELKKSIRNHVKLKSGKMNLNQLKHELLHTTNILQTRSLLLRYKQLCRYDKKLHFLWSVSKNYLRMKVTKNNVKVTA